MDNHANDDVGSPDTSPLQLPVFRAVWAASMVSNLGGMIQSVGASWMMASLTASPQMVALVQASTSLPIMLLSLWAGAVADNRDRRKVMLVAQIFMMTISVILAAMAWAGLLTPWWLLSLTFMIGCGIALNGPAWQASVGDMVPRSALPSAVALNSVAFNISRSLGPAIGGAIVAAAGAAVAFLVNTVSYFGLIAVLARWRPALPPRQLPRERIAVAMAAGVRYVAMSPPICIILVHAALLGMASSAIPAMMPLVARDLIGGGALIYGLLLGGFGLGAVGGALTIGWLRKRLSSEWVVRAASICLAVGAAGGGASNMLELALAAMIAAGAGWVLALSTFNVSVQMASPRWVVARALALYQMAVFGGMTLGSWIFGVIADVQGPAVALFASAAVQCTVLLVGFRLPLQNISSANLDPHGRWTEPQTTLPIETRSGPIVVTIEHRIPQVNVRTFLAAMNERRRIRRRDGAHNWTLLRDLGDPELWVERYQVPTWTDYVRHNKRGTHADDANSELLRTLRAEGYEPVVRRMIERQTGSLPGTRALDPRQIAGPMTDPSGSN